LRQRLLLCWNPARAPLPGPHRAGGSGSVRRGHASLRHEVQANSGNRRPRQKPCRRNPGRSTRLSSLPLRTFSVRQRPEVRAPGRIQATTIEQRSRAGSCEKHDVFNDCRDRQVRDAAENLRQAALHQRRTGPLPGSRVKLPVQVAPSINSTSEPGHDAPRCTPGSANPKSVPFRRWNSSPGLKVEGRHSSWLAEDEACLHAGVAQGS